MQNCLEKRLWKWFSQKCRAQCETLDIVNQEASDTPSASSGLPRLDGSFGARKWFDGLDTHFLEVSKAIDSILFFKEVLLAELVE